MEEDAALLHLEGVRKSFGATLALRGVDLLVARGEVHALVGENGAGKSTLMKILSGAHRADGGTLTLEGRPYLPENPHDARLKGVAMIYQELSLAPHLTVQENILLGTESARAGWIDRGAGRRRAGEALAQLGRPGLPLDRPAGQCPIADQQVVEIARALVTRPKVLILDEPTSSLTPADTEMLFAAILRLKAGGVSVIYISHFLEECRSVADRYTVLKDGETVGTGRMADASLDQIVALMTGRRLTELYPRRRGGPGSAVLEVTAAARAPRLRRADLRLRRGEIFGLAGLIGSGRTDLLRSVFGLERLDAGQVALAGSPPGRATPGRRWRDGVGFLSENRKEEGLMLDQPVADNLTLTKLSSFGRWGWIGRGRQHAAARRWIGELRIACRGPEQPAGQLSGGSQQKLALARLLEHPAAVLLLDEPTRGIDVGSKAEIYRVIAELADAGKAVILVSSYFPELLGLCDTIGVMFRGELVAVRPRAQWSEPEIMRLATGGK